MSPHRCSTRPSKPHRRQVGGERIEIGLDLQRGDTSSTTRARCTAGPPDARSDVEHSHAGLQSESVDGFVDGRRAEVVVVVEWRQQFDRQRRRRRCR
jgi:hypothetical protein